MAVVFFTHAFPPLKYAQSIQVARFVKFSTHDIRVICCDEDFGKDHSIAEEMNGKPFEQFTVKREQSRGGLLSRLLAHVLVPDQYRSWSLSAAEKALEQSWVSSKDLLITFGEPMSVHLAGLRIKRAIDMPWIAHFSDPWVDNPHRRLPVLRQLNGGLEAEVVSAADRLIFTSEETLHLVMRKYPVRMATKSLVLPHSFDPTMYRSIHDGHNGIIVRYVGNFYGRRKPDPLIKAVQQLYRERPEVLQGVTIEFVGGIRRIPTSLLDALPATLIRFVPSVDYKTSLALMESADLLLVIDAPFEQSVFLPSKLIDYIGAQRPILAITPPGTSAKLVSDLGGLVAHPKNIGGVAEMLAESLMRLRMSTSAKAVNPLLRQEFAAPAVASRLDSIIDEVRQNAAHSPC
jgi:glycosyltransferase involved in cell wall biosynthesis